MALSNKTDPRHAERQLTAWLSTRLEDANEVRVHDAHVPTAGGLSAETLLFEASWVQSGKPRTRSLAARVQPSGHAVFPAYDLAKEFRVLAALGCAGVPVPEALRPEQDHPTLGGKLLVLAR